MTRSTWRAALPLLLAGCAGAAETVVETQIVERVVTQEVQVEVRAEAYTTPHAILSDIRVRKAIAFCTNRPDLIASVYTFVDDPNSLLMDTFIPSDHWAHAAGVEQYPFDTAQGMALLDEAGWTLAEGADFRTNAAGEELALHFTTTNAEFRQTWGAVFESNMADCGIRIVRLHAPASWWFGDTTGLLRRDFELGAFAWVVFSADPAGNTLYACDAIPLPSNGWAGQNYMGWCNEAASNAIKLANNTLNRDERIAQYTIVQQEFAKDMVSLPLFNRPLVMAYRPELKGVEVDGGEIVYTWNAAQWEIPGRDTIVLGFGSEPATLFSVVDNSFVNQLLNALLEGKRFNTLAYDQQPGTQRDFATVENTLATREAVKVNGGDLVVDAGGSLGELQPGMRVRASDGNEVVYNAGTLEMDRLIVPYRFVEGLTWSDGTAVSQVDFELFHRIACDPESGAESYATCDQVDTIAFDPHGYTITWRPGMLRPTYAQAPFGYFPSHVVLGDGRRLADVPAAEWIDLDEVSRHPPVSSGPYTLLNWDFGRGMTLEANPYYYGTAPRTRRLEIRFVEQNTVEDLLRSGAIDFAGWDLVGGSMPNELAGALAEAGREGVVTFVVVPSSTWEHVDMNLFVP